MKLGVLIVIIVFMVSIVASLGWGLFYLVADRKQNPKTLKALTFRITLSLILFGLLLAGFIFGWIQPHGLYG